MEFSGISDCYHLPVGFTNLFVIFLRGQGDGRLHRASGAAEGNEEHAVISLPNENVSPSTCQKKKKKNLL